MKHSITRSPVATRCSSVSQRTHLVLKFWRQVGTVVQSPQDIDECVWLYGSVVIVFLRVQDPPVRQNVIASKDSFSTMMQNNGESIITNLLSFVVMYFAPLLSRNLITALNALVPPNQRKKIIIMT